MSNFTFHLLLQAIAGLIVGKITGQVLGKTLLGMALGAIGGAIGGQIIGWLIPDLSAEGGPDLDHLIGVIAAGAVSGAISVAIFFKFNSWLSRP
jgi:hypothetical protein